MYELEGRKQMWIAIEQSVSNIRKLERLLVLIENRPEGMAADDHAENVRFLINQVRYQLTGHCFRIQELININKWSIDDEIQARGIYSDDDESYGENPRVGNTGVNLPTSDERPENEESDSSVVGG